MKSITKVLFLIPLMTTLSFGSEAVTQIRKDYYAIQNNLANYSKDSRQICGDEGAPWTCASYTAYSDSTGVRKIVKEYGEEGTATTEELFFTKGKLIFIFEKNEEYGDPDLVCEERLYVHNGVIVKSLCRKGTAETINNAKMTACKTASNSNTVKYAQQVLATYTNAVNKE